MWTEEDRLTWEFFVTDQQNCCSNDRTKEENRRRVNEENLQMKDRSIIFPRLVRSIRLIFKRHSFSFCDWFSSAARSLTLVTTCSSWFSLFLLLLLLFCLVVYLSWLTHTCERAVVWRFHITFNSCSYESFFLNLLAILASSSSSSDEDLCGCPAPKRTRLTSTSPRQHFSSAPKTTCPMSTTTTASDPTLLERLKSATSHCNGSAAAFQPVSTQTSHSLTDSQREVLRLIGQHLQSLGLR